jgi:hypothetical protein
LPARAYHLAEAANLPSIKRHGLLSASRLLALAGAGREERARRERTHRPEREVLTDGIVIRDQKPMSPALLGRCLIGTTPAEWYALLNSKVFFWFDDGRLERLARTYRPIPMVVLVLDTAGLLTRHAARAAVTPINTGNARPYRGHSAAPRGRATFVPYATWLDSGWASERAGLGLPPRATAPKPAELVIEDAVPDAMELLVEARQVAPVGAG